MILAFKAIYQRSLVVLGTILAVATLTGCASNVAVSDASSDIRKIIETAAERVATAQGVLVSIKNVKRLEDISDKASRGENSLGVTIVTPNQTSQEVVIALVRAVRRELIPMNYTKFAFVTTDGNEITVPSLVLAESPVHGSWASLLAGPGKLYKLDTFSNFWATRSELVEGTLTRRYTNYGVTAGDCREARIRL